MVGKIAELALNMNDVHKMSRYEINDCIEIFSEMDISLELKKHIWARLDKVVNNLHCFFCSLFIS